MHLFNFSEGLARIKKSGYVQKKKKKGESEPEEWVFIDKDFKEALNLHYFWVGDFKDGLARFVSKGYRGFINKAGEEVIVIRIGGIDWIEDFSEGLARVQFLDGSMGYIDLSGNIVYRK
ncbi:MAG: WG repeat-containing protein [bacterium]